MRAVVVKIGPAVAALAALALVAAAPVVPEEPGTTEDAAEDCVDLEVEGGFAPTPVGALVPCPGIRPGARMSAPAGCTFNFVWRGTSTDEDGLPVDEGLFIGTAGHCVFDEVMGDTVWAEGDGIEVRDATGRRVGETVWGIDEGDWDYALIRVDDEREEEVEPAMCHFGGPVELAPTLSPRTLVHHFGHGMGFGNTIQGRTGSHDHYSGGGVVANFAGAAAPGDSGSGVIDEHGRAIGALVRLAVGELTGPIEVTTIAEHLPRATAMTGIEFELVTAPLAP